MTDQQTAAKVNKIAQLEPRLRRVGITSVPSKRSGEYHQAPGEEMQHDTSPHRVVLSGKSVSAQCAALTLAYSRWLFFQYYPRFTRFGAKQLLLEGVRFNDGSCPLCIIDSTSVLVEAGSGPEAVIAPEMIAFARSFRSPELKEIQGLCAETNS